MWCWLIPLIFIVAGFIFGVVTGCLDGNPHNVFFGSVIGFFIYLIITIILCVPMVITSSGSEPIREETYEIILVDNTVPIVDNTCFYRVGEEIKTLKNSNIDIYWSDTVDKPTLERKEFESSLGFIRAWFGNVQKTVKYSIIMPK